LAPLSQYAINNMTKICKKLYVWLVGKLLRITRAKRYVPMIPRTLPIAARSSGQG
jgi:hypothetical protein